MYILLKVICLSPLVLSWDGEVSAISKDAVEDVRQAKFDTVIDEWDEEFDRGKVRKRLSSVFRPVNLQPGCHSPLELLPCFLYE